MNRHYFLGIQIPPQFKSYVEEVRSKYRLREAYKAIPYIEDLHITLLFLGSVPENKISLLTEQLTETAKKHKPFSLSVNGVSCFGSFSSPRVIYLSVEDNRELNTLQHDIRNEVAGALAVPIDNRFVPHITIAKKWKGTSDFSFNKEKREPIEVPVSAFSLFTIYPQKIPKYEAVFTFTLN